MLRPVLPALVAATAAFCQTAPPPAFQTASIKLSPPSRSDARALLGDDIQTTPGGLTMRRVTLKSCVAWAYHVFQFQVNGPASIDSDRYEIDAKTDGPVQEADLRLMLQTLLADRFDLKVHHDFKEISALVLTVGKNGPKFHESKADGDSEILPDQKTMTVTVRRVPISQIIDPLSRILQAPIIDRTGLTGRYDVAINIVKYLPQLGDRPDPVATITFALQEELGLKLDSKKVPIDYLIVDHAAKSPKEN